MMISGLLMGPGRPVTDLGRGVLKIVKDAAMIPFYGVQPSIEKRYR
jgi:hypothetical protein